MTTADAKPTTHFIKTFIDEDLASGRFDAPIVTRFPPEPNGYLHIGHTKALCIDFGLAKDYDGICHLRFDDTNPVREKQEYIDGIKQDITWLGFEWGDHEYYTSDYFDQLYSWAVKLIDVGKAYVDEQTVEQIREARGTLTTPGTPSPFRDRPIAESVDLFARMKAGDFPDGSHVLRAKIDMASPNLNLRDPIMYRVLHADHPRTGNTWCVYPMYDYAHGQSDSIEKITHSLCSLEFEDHRPLYDWFISELGIFPTRQIEFARGNITYTVTSKRKLMQLVDQGHVTGWDDPRMPTLVAMRRRGYPPKAIIDFWETVGVAKRENNIEVALLEHCVRTELNKAAPRRMAVLDPLKLVITNYPDGQVEEMDCINNPEDPDAGTRKVPFCNELYIEREDFMEDAPKKFFRLAPGKEVRLRSAYWVKCEQVIKDDAGKIIELRCTYDPQTRGGGNPPDGRKVKGTLHWVSAKHAIDAKACLYDHLFTAEDPTTPPKGSEDWLDNINPDSIKTLDGAKLEPSLADAEAGVTFQFERVGYFCLDSKDAATDRPVFNRTITLKDAWAKMQKKGR
jgi:glutaminyl-tRNA synthetase